MNLKYISIAAVKLISFPASNTISLPWLQQNPNHSQKSCFYFFTKVTSPKISAIILRRKNLFSFFLHSTLNTHTIWNYTFNLHLHLHYTLHFYTYTNTKTLTLTLTLTLTHISHKSHTATQRGSTRYTHTHTTQYNVIYFFIVVIHTAE